jgi:hypothetical protein
MKLKFLPIILLMGMLATTVRLQGQESTGNPFAQSKFVPDISLIFDSLFVIRDLGDEWFTASGCLASHTPAQRTEPRN